MEIFPLAEAPLEEMDRIFEEETRRWEQELYWDYRSAAALIRRYIHRRTLPGFILRNSPQGEVLGYAYYVIDHPVGYIGNLYVRNDSARPELYRRLLHRTVSTLIQWGHVDRIECQVFPFNCNLVPLFREEHFLARRRYFLTALTEQFREFTPAEGPYRIVPWDPKLTEAAAAAIYDSYCGSPDFELCQDYQSLPGCLKYLRNLVDNAGCGTFVAETSRLALDPSGRVCGVLLTSLISAETGMIPQISIRRDCQGQGLGSRLLKAYLQEARNRGLKRVTLSVSEANQGAFQLYRRVGFEINKVFHAFIWVR